MKTIKKPYFRINFLLFISMLLCFVAVFFSISKERRSGYFQQINKPQQQIKIANATDMASVVANVIPSTFTFAMNMKIMYAHHILSLLAVSSTCYVLKHIIDEKRPDDQSDTKSFPSGHSAFAFCGATNMVIATIRRRRRKIEKQKRDIFINFLCLANIFLAFATATGRVLASRHWPIDVLCGSLLGIIGTIATYYCVGKILKRKAKI